MTREGYRWQSTPWRPSDTQARILDGVAQGKTNPQIAAELGMTLDGVKWHISRALSETSLDDRQSLARWWQGGPLRMSLGGSNKQPATSNMGGPAGFNAAPRPLLDYTTSMRRMALSHGQPDGRGYAWRVLALAEPTSFTDNELLANV